MKIRENWVFQLLKFVFITQIIMVLPITIGSTLRSGVEYFNKLALPIFIIWYLGLTGVMFFVYFFSLKLFDLFYIIVIAMLITIKITNRGKKEVVVSERYENTYKKYKKVNKIIIILYTIFSIINTSIGVKNLGALTKDGVTSGEFALKALYIGNWFYIIVLISYIPNLIRLIKVQRKEGNECLNTDTMNK